MPVILLEKDPFVEIEERAGEQPLQHNVNVRRPLYGVTVKQPRFAYLSVHQAASSALSTSGDGVDDGAGSAISIIDSSAPGGFSDANHNFILQSIQETRQEKVQIIETFGDHFAFFYGQKPIILSVSGMLFNTADFNWKNEWLANYENYLRGTRAVENRTRVFLGWDDVLAQGYILNTAVVYDKDLPYVCPFQFSILLTHPPTDLSSGVGASAATYRGSTVTVAEEARGWEEGWRNDGREDLRSSGRTYLSEPSAGRLLPEYVTEIEQRPKVSLDPATGLAVKEAGSDASPNAPSAVDNPRQSTAYWLTGQDPSTKMWKSVDEALLFLNTDLTSQQTGVDKVTVRQALKTAPASFQLASRDSASILAATALGRGVTNAATVIDDAPTLE